MRRSFSFPIVRGRYQFSELPAVPADLAAMSLDDLRALEEQLRAYFTERRAETMTPEIVTELRTVVEHVRHVQAAIAAAPAGDPADFSADLADLDAALETAATDPPAEGSPAADPADPAATLELTASLAPVELSIDAEALGRGIGEGMAAAMASIQASAYETRGPGRISRLSDYRDPAMAPALTAGADGGGEPERHAVITASAETGVAGDLTDFDQVVEAFRSRSESLPLAMDKDYARTESRGREYIVGEKVKVVHVQAQYPEDRMIHSGQTSVIKQVEHVTDPDAIAASGGLCAPVAPFYTQIVVADSQRPVAAALPTFGADRGGLRYVPPPTLASLLADSPDPNPYFLGDAVGVETVAEDAAGGSKLCLDVPCNDIQEVDIDIIWRCLQFANVTSRTFPEQVEAFVRLVNAAWAQAAEQVLLDGIAAASTPVTLAKTFGTARQVLAQLGRAAAYMRNHNRTDPKLTLRVLLPAWVRDAMRADMAYTFAGSMDFFSYADAMIDEQLADYGIVASWYIDTKTGGGQTFSAAVSGSALPNYPSTIEAFMFFEGNFLHLDAGILDLGIIRDSTLTALNKFRNFGESFENVVFIGPEALELTLTTCPDGGLAAAYVIAGQACTGDE